ncbi:hypothetical protein [Pseudoclavibacter sp. 13-3]|uniref:hypothetical protein n=1 Tax=Pseudoclavibacter sp. 13-3 TaxID=2901228 RepID=UPI001E65836B|nr:hypothetical protein [Pseudoclavibacter sp. 13-3]MCD7100459.1 hypothetical protein [Pseudoclavibacter sp. 13-3]
MAQQILLAAPRERLVTLGTEVLPPHLVDEHGLPRLTLGFEAIDWMETNLIQPNGPRSGRPVTLMPSQAKFLLWFYAVDDDGHWLFNRASRRLAKGSGKSPFAAMLALHELLGPSRLFDFDEKIPGGCRGVPVQMPLVNVAATSLDQTANTMRMVRAMSNKRSKLARRYDLEVGKTYLETPEGGRLQQITSSATSAEGAELSFAVADETEHWTAGNGGPDLAETLDQNLAKTGGRLMETCNAWIPGIGSVAETVFDSWAEQQEWLHDPEHPERLNMARQQILYDARVAPHDTNLSDQDSLQTALEFVYEGLPWVKIRDIMQRIWNPTFPASRSRRFFLNQPNAAEDAMFTLEDWAALGPTATDDEMFPHVADGDEVVLFFDGSKSRDATALVGCRMSDGHLFTVKVWEPSPEHPVNVADVNVTVHQTFDRFKVVAFFADVREWESFTKVHWPEDFADDLVLWAVPKGKDRQPIAWDMRSHKYEFAEATEMFLTEVQEGAFTHDGNWDLSRHIGNIRRGEVRGHLYPKKDSDSSSSKIDAGVCAIGARMVRRIVLASDAWEDRNSDSGFVVWN